jgi:hypothetical protein
MLNKFGVRMDLCELYQGLQPNDLDLVIILDKLILLEVEFMMFIKTPPLS